MDNIKETLKAGSRKITDVRNRLIDSVGEGEGGMFRENSIETSILSRVKHHQHRLDAWDKNDILRNKT